MNRTQYPSDVIALVVLWRFRYKLSLCDLPEMFLIRGIVFSHDRAAKQIDVRDWESKLTPALAENLRRRRRGKAGRSRYVDETYIKVHGKWCFLYRAIDRAGELVDVMFSEHRDMEAPKAFFELARTLTEPATEAGNESAAVQCLRRRETAAGQCHGEDVVRRFTQPSARGCPARQPGRRSGQRHPHQQADADLLGDHLCNVGHRMSLDLRADRQSQENYQHGHADTIVQSAFDVERLTDRRRHRRLRHDGLSQRRVGGR